MKKIHKAIGILTCLVIGFFIGYALDALVFSAENHVTDKKNLTLYDQPMPNWNLTNPNKLIRFSTTDDIENKRKELIQFIWKTKNISDALPEVENDISDERYKKIPNLKQIDKLTITMKHDLKSIAYHFKPTRKVKNKVILYHRGHDGDFIKGYDTIKFFVKQGYDVIAFSMPLLGLNSEPIGETGRFGNLVETKAYGTIRLADHNAFFLLDDETFTSLQFFVEPIAEVMNHVEKEYAFDMVTMVGVSGGGWVATLYAALDPRIEKSYPVASPPPFYVLANDYDKTMGTDYDTINPELYNRANVLELYIMGAMGKNRKQLRVYNKYDECCFNGPHHETYETVVQDKVKSLGEGSFYVFLDDTHVEHKISETAHEIILQDIEE